MNTIKEAYAKSKATFKEELKTIGQTCNDPKMRRAAEKKAGADHQARYFTHAYIMMAYLFLEGEKQLDQVYRVILSVLAIRVVTIRERKYWGWY